MATLVLQPEAHAVGQLCLAIQRLFRSALDMLAMTAGPIDTRAITIPYVKITAPLRNPSSGAIWPKTNHVQTPAQGAQRNEMVRANQRISSLELMFEMTTSCIHPRVLSWPVRSSARYTQFVKNRAASRNAGPDITK